MKLILNIEDRKVKGKNGRKPRNARVMWMTLRTNLEGMEHIDSIAELPKGTPLYSEVDNLTVQLLEAKKKEIEAKRKADKKLKK